MNNVVYRIASLIVACAMISGNIIHARAAGNAYYVSPTGSDTNPGTVSAPFKTFAKANSVLSAGSTLHIYAGTYNQQLRISKSGTGSAWITVKPVGGAVVLDMQNAASAGLDIRASFVAVSGLEVINSGDICANLLGSNITVDGIVIHECWNHGIQANNSSQIKILNSRVYRTVLSNASRTLLGGWGSGIKVRLSDNVLIQGNIVYNNYGEGMGTRGTNITIRANTVYDNYSVNIYTNSENALIERNFVYCQPNSGFERSGSPAAGISMGEEYFDGWGARLINARVINNIVAFCKHGVRYNGPEEGVLGGGLKTATIAYNTLYGSTNSALSIVYGSAQAGSLIANNIIWPAGNHLAAIDNPTGLTFQNNLWKALPPVALRSPGDRVGDPVFASTPGYTAESYRLSSSSPAAGGAADIGISSDFFARQREPAFDMGSVQFTSASVGLAPSTTAISLSPTVPPTGTAPPTQAVIQPTRTAVAASPTPTTLSPTPPSTQVSTAGHLTFTPSADSFVKAGNPAANYGTATSLRMNGSPVIRGYLRFNVQGLSGAPTKVTLRIFARSAASAGFSISGVSDTTWTESAINYDNAPAVGNMLGSSGAVGKGTWVSVDLTAYVTGNGTYNLALSTTGSSAASFASRESGAKAPQLIVQTTP
jgi:hypothetical protein